MKKILFIFGTRPEAIKLAPLIIGMKNRKMGFSSCVCVTSQHKDMLKQVLCLFEIIPDYDLGIMKEGQSLSDVTVKGIERIQPVFEKEKPEAVMVQGDTSTTFLASLAAYYNKIKIGHVEAGLRTGDKYNPFPEEQFRRMTDALSDWCFAPTKTAAQNLIKENINRENIFITGNTGIDALFMTLEKQKSSSVEKKFKVSFHADYGMKWEGKRNILVTIHRRESFGSDFLNICRGIKELAERFPQIQIVWPVHPNPKVYQTVQSQLNSVSNIFLISPLDYSSFIWMMKQSYLILTDSGGIQEEAPSLGKPVLVLRKKTERPEGIRAGTARLIGVQSQEIVEHTGILINDESSYQAMAQRVNPYGDGKASQRIMRILEENL
jgi:UDP-N-acetylglucosamine 2-epimerase (non-hydrolysing)